MWSDTRNTRQRPPMQWWVLLPKVRHVTAATTLDAGLGCTQTTAVRSVPPESRVCITRLFCLISGKRTRRLSGPVMRDRGRATSGRSSDRCCTYGGKEFRFLYPLKGLKNSNFPSISADHRNSPLRQGGPGRWNSCACRRDQASAEGCGLESCKLQNCCHL
jgi:hypothetical protein